MRSLALACLFLAAGPALASPAIPAAAVAPSPKRETIPSESGLATTQWLGALAVSVAGAYMGAAGGGDDTSLVGVFLGAPAVTGLVVCAIGDASRHSQGSCGASIGGAYAGALTGPALGLAFASLADGHDAPYAFLAGVVLGWFVVQPITSTVAWHLFKTPKPKPALPAAAAVRAPVRAPRTTAPGQISLSLLSFGF